MKGRKVCVVQPFISLFAAFNQRCFLQETSLAFAEEQLSSAAPGGGRGGHDNNLHPIESLWCLCVQVARH